MKKLWFLLPLFFFATSLAADKYGSFSELKNAREAGRDYIITVLDRHAPVTVFAIHGGEIERGTSDIARVCAGGDWNFYSFTALDKEHARDYHITATKFDEPGAVRLATASVLGIAIHGQREGEDVICLGGRNAELRKRTAAELREDGFSVEEPCKRLPGESAKNIANRPSDGGIQLEFSQKILKRLTENGSELVKFCAALKDSVNGYLLQKQSKVIPAESGGFSTGADGVKP